MARKYSLCRAAAFTIAIAGLGFGCTGKDSGADTETLTVEGRGGDTAKWWEKLPRAQWANYERVAEGLEWFEAYRVFEGVYAIYEPGQFEEVISFLIVGETRALLFDTGLGIAKLRPVVARLTDLDILVLNSHGHYDHIGGNYEFSEIGGLDVDYARAQAKGAEHEYVAEYVSGDWLWKQTPDGFDPEAYEIKPYQVTTTIKDGDIIDLGGVRLEVLVTPGHSPDSICLLDRAGRRLFTGDTFYLAPLYAHLEGSNVADYRASIDRLAALEPELDHLLTAHNVPLAEPAYLSRVSAGFEAISSKSAAYVETDGAFEYQFDGFSIIVPATEP
ncbi:MAG: MBL fold metallo-hydrolase [Alphaproteobacteria bacterium]|nr:MBL fold metallo-hydrolase [Alphaproteobacteria bacterium]